MAAESSDTRLDAKETQRAAVLRRKAEEKRRREIRTTKPQKRKHTTAKYDDERKEKETSCSALYGLLLAVPLRCLLEEGRAAPRKAKRDDDGRRKNM